MWTAGPTPYLLGPSPARSSTEAKGLLVAQTTGRDDPTRVDEILQAGYEVRLLMRRAAEVGARVMHFPEGAMCT